MRVGRRNRTLVKQQVRQLARMGVCHGDVPLVHLLRGEKRACHAPHLAVKHRDHGQREIANHVTASGHYRPKLFYQVIVHVCVGLVCQYVRRHGAVNPEPALQAVALFHLRPVHVGVNHAQAYRNICGQRSRLIRPCVPSGRTETPHQGNRHGQ